MHDKPWEALVDLVEDGASPAQVESFLESLPSGDAARAVLRLSEAERSRLLSSLDPETAAEVIEALPDTEAARLIRQLDPESAAAIVSVLASDEQADLLGELSQEIANVILDALKPEDALRARHLSSYPEDVAGGLMITEFLSYPVNRTVDDVVRDLRENAERYREYQVQYAYVTDARDRLVGVLPLRELLLAHARQPLQQIMIPDPLTVSELEELDALEDLFETHHFFAVPVIDLDARLCGVVLRESIERAVRDQHDDDYRRSQGLVHEELRSMPLLVRTRRRLAWLSINVLLNVLAASVIAFHQDTLESVIALAVFLPIISDMSGCSGNQAVAVSMRELALGAVRPSEVFYVLGKEAGVGLLNGFALGTLIAIVAWLWKGNAYLGLVVGGALALNTLIAVCIGGVVPLLLKRSGRDPALASGPILTTVTDMCGFFIVLTLASILLPYLENM